jgi:hypothetical protein
VSEDRKKYLDLYNSEEAQGLRQAMLEGLALLQKAQAAYEDAIKIANDIGDINPDGVVGLQNHIREYAYSVRTYQNAAMEWLAYTDRTIAEAKKFVREKKAKAGE